MIIFPDENGVMNRSVVDVDVDGEILAVSQFTLLASTKKGNRPSYIRAAGHALAILIYELYYKGLFRLMNRGQDRTVWCSHERKPES